MSEDRAMKAYGDIMDIALQLDREHALAIRDAANAMKAEIVHGRSRNAALGNAIELASQALKEAQILLKPRHHRLGSIAQLRGCVLIDDACAKITAVRGLQLGHNT
ncbi:MAG: hypothetical protein RJQ08_13540 [Salinisphaeraceae bacterium]